MMPYLVVLGRPIPMYGLCALMGLLLGGILIGFSLKKRKDYSKIYIINIPLIAALGAFVGAHFVYALTRINVMVKAFSRTDIYFSSFETGIKTLGSIFGGMVFYGGLLGALLAAFIYCKAAHVDFDLYSDIFTPAIPLFHAFGRLGCTFAGCCYGLESDWGVPVIHQYDNGEFFTATHLPIPLIEAGCNLILCIALVILSRKRFKKGTLLGIYFVLYAVIRFTDEFFRGDLIRGQLLGLSTSQWISIVVFIIGTIMLLKRYVLKSKERYGYRVPKGDIPEGYTYNKYAGAISPWEQEKLARKQAAAAVAAGADNTAAEANEAEGSDEAADPASTNTGSDIPEKSKAKDPDTEDSENTAH